MKKQKPFQARLEERVYLHACNFFRHIERHIGNPDVVTQFIKAAGSLQIGVVFEENKMRFERVDIPKPPSYNDLVTRVRELEVEKELREQKT